MKPTSKTLSWAFVIILLAVGIFTGLGVILIHAGGTLGAITRVDVRLG